MKNLNVIHCTLIGLFLVGLFACTKDNAVTDAEITQEEIQALVEGSLSVTSEGLAAEAMLAGQVASLAGSNATVSCGVTNDSSIQRSGNLYDVTYLYVLEWDWTLNCNNFKVPTSIDFQRKASGGYEARRLHSDDQTLGTWKIEGLQPGASQFILNGTYKRQGTQVSQIRLNRSFESTLDYQVQNLTVHKSTYRIESGNATFTLNGKGNQGNSFSAEGSVQFLGDGMAVVTLNGTTYEIDLNN